MPPARTQVRPTGFDRVLTPLHRWIGRDPERRVQTLIRFGETETDGGRDILRAAEVTSDPLLRRLYLVHAIDELRHGILFRKRAASLLPALPPSAKPRFRADWLAPGGHGFDDLLTGGSMAHLASGLWRSDTQKPWLIPLAIFLCLTGLILILAATVEGLAPFIYSIW